MTAENGLMTMDRTLSEIRDLINYGQIDEAKRLLSHYDYQTSDSPDLLAIVATLALLENDYHRAQEVVSKGLARAPEHPDLLYNTAVMYQKLGEYKAAIKFFEKAQGATTDPLVRAEIKLQLYAIRRNLEGNRPRVLLGSFVDTESTITEFLQSLAGLSKDGLRLDFRLIDGISNETSRYLLKRWSDYLGGAVEVLTPGKEVLSQFGDDQGGAAARIHFKNSLIEVALKEKYDYLFIVDSDLLVHPLTLRQLVALEKQVICEVAWKKPNAGAPQFPQVWLLDGSNSHRVDLAQSGKPVDVILRKQAFMQRLKQPGVYETNGIGKGVLFHRSALERGLRYDRIPGLSFLGEDQHLSVRAQALGIPLYVDTHFPMLALDSRVDSRTIEWYRNTVLTGAYPLKKSITLVYVSVSNSNTRALAQLVPEQLRLKYDIELVRWNPQSADYLERVFNSDAVVVTDANYGGFDKRLFNPRQLVVELWHGIPLKAVGYEDRGEKHKHMLHKLWINVDYVISYSKFYSDLFERCFRVGSEKYIVAGAPRNDFLFTGAGKEKLRMLSGVQVESSRVVMYLPTFRNAPRLGRRDSDYDWQHLFGMPTFDLDDFHDFLERENIFFVMKLHPSEEPFVRHQLAQGSPRMILLSDDQFERADCHFYEVLNGADLLITDYSSVYFDFLLLDRPMIFVPTDLDEYSQRRGFLLAPYDEWTPGPKVHNQEELQSTIVRCLEEPSWYAAQRRKIRDLAHAYQDDKSSLRVWTLLDQWLDS